MLVQEPVLELVLVLALVLVLELVLVLALVLVLVLVLALVLVLVQLHKVLLRPAICRSGSWLQESVLHSIPRRSTNRSTMSAQGLCHNQAWLMVRNLSYS